MMAFTLCPDDGPPRLWRFVEPGGLPPGVLASLDDGQNLLIIDKELFDRMCWLDQHRLLRTQRSTTYY